MLESKDCLIIQLKEKTKYIDLAIDIIENSFEQFSKKHFEKLMNSTQLTKHNLKIISLISKLNPKPGGSYAGGGKP